MTQVFHKIARQSSVRIIFSISSASPIKPVMSLPHFAQGAIVKGFGRGSKELGIPTANFANDVVDKLPNDFDTGIYYGWAQLDHDKLYKMVMSVGWNPFYNNSVKSMETHIMHEFDGDLYGQWLKVCIVGFIRPELNFNSLDELVKTIKNDIKLADEYLESGESQTLKDHEFFKR